MQCLTAVHTTTFADGQLRWKKERQRRPKAKSTALQTTMLGNHNSDRSDVFFSSYIKRRRNAWRLCCGMASEIGEIIIYTVQCRLQYRARLFGKGHIQLAQMDPNGVSGQLFSITCGSFLHNAQRTRFQFITTGIPWLTSQLRSWKR